MILNPVQIKNNFFVMYLEAEKISNYESEAVQKNKAVMKSKFAERYQRMQGRKNDCGSYQYYKTVQKLQRSNLQ